MSAVSLQALALAGAAFMIAACLGAALVRSLFAVLAFMMAAALAAAIALIALGAPSAALATGLIAACFATALMLGGVLLTARAAKERPARARLFALAGAPLAIGAILFASPAAAPTIEQGPPPVVSTLALAALVIVGAAAALGLLGADAAKMGGRAQPQSRTER